MSITPLRVPCRRGPAPRALAVGIMGAILLAVGWYSTLVVADDAHRAIDFNRDIRPILSNRCFACHGPDAAQRKGGSRPLRLDTEAGAREDLGGYAAVVPGRPDESELIQRIVADDPTEVMPPPKHGAKVSAAEVERLTQWISQGAAYAKHWSYRRPSRPELPAVRDATWPRNAVDRFLLARIEQEGLQPSPEADRPTLIRRLALDLTGLPPTPAEVDEFVRDARPDAYEALVDRLLARPSYGEHWGRLWLDLARYADSAGYADDPEREIWAYRDYVIRSFNANKPFDRFTVEQIAGDLLPDATAETTIATAFHRNTMTNSEGGTNDEEFRNAAVVDRVNTTMAVWMGTTIACAQCHDHKYDPLSQADYFRLFAFFNNTEDADRNDESPRFPVESADLQQRRAEAQAEAERLERSLRTASPESDRDRSQWEQSLREDLRWQAPRPDTATARDGSALPLGADGSVRVEGQADRETLTISLPVALPRLSALRIEVLPDDSDLKNGAGPAGATPGVAQVRATIVPPGGSRPLARYLRVELLGPGKWLSLAEVQAFRGVENVARAGSASQSSTAFDGPARLAIDGNTNGDYAEARSTTHTAASADPWWEVDLGSPVALDRVVLWNRTDGNLQSRLDGARVILLGEGRVPVWSQTVAKAPRRSAEYAPSGESRVAFAAAYADGSGPSAVVGERTADGWSLAKAPNRPNRLTLLSSASVAAAPGSSLVVAVERDAKRAGSPPGRLRLSISDDERAATLARLPASVLMNLKGPTPPGGPPAEELARYYLAEVAPAKQADRAALAAVRNRIAQMKPETTVPILRELGPQARRTTRIQQRGNYLNLGEVVTEGVPEAIWPLPPGSGRDRLALARWLVADENPLTARVIANRYWEAIFGVGLVPTSEEFGSQGDLPTHPELLDWLATELVAQRWDLKQLLRLLVTSAAYRQSSRATPEALRVDPANQWLARGPRFRLPAETVRDQALAVAGLLSARMYGPPVRPPQPASGLSAAFGSKIDWQTSRGEDRYRRGIYTSWRRSNPYPSLATFDAPNREVCTVRRVRTNTPLQALVTLNDPVYVEAAQGLARRLVASGPDPAARIQAGFRLCLARDPSAAEVGRLLALHRDALARLAADPAAARRLATEPLGPAPEGSDPADLAAWTVIGNVLLNLDETLMRR